LAKVDKIVRVKLPRWATALDVLAVVMAILTISVVLAGGFRVTVLGLRISMMEWWRPALWVVLAAAIRHAVVRADPLPQRVVRGVRGWWRRRDTRIVLPIHLASRLGVLAVGFLAVSLIGFPPQAESRWRIYSNDLLDLPARWDAGWYLAIANGGYEFDPLVAPQIQQNVAFFPAYPMAVRHVSALFGRQPLWTAVVISLVAFFLALVYFLRLARSELGSDDQAATAVVLLAAYPFAVFFSAAYTESLFLLTLVGAVHHFRQNQLWRSAIWGVLCGLTRPNGCFLSIALGLMAVAPMWDTSRGRLALPPPIGWPAIGRRLAAAAAPGAGMLMFSAFIYRLTGSPFTWAAQNVAWGRVYRSLDSILMDRVGYIADNGLYLYASTQTIDLLYALAVLLALGAVWPVYRRFGLPYAVFILVNVLAPMSAGGLLSMGRVTSILFPVFLWLGAAVPATQRTAWIALFAVLQGFVAVMFFTWRPLY
jgi:hypothetical protein